MTLCRILIVQWSYCLFVSLIGFYVISTFVGYLMQNPFLYNKQFYFKQFSLAWEHNLIVKAFLFQDIGFSQTARIQTVQFKISIDFVYTQLSIKTVLFQTIPFNTKNSSILNNSV